MRKKTPETSKLSRTIAAPYTLRKPESDNNPIVAKNDKTEAKADAKPKVDAKPAAPEETGAPKPGDGPKAATQNELPTEPHVEAPAEPEPEHTRARTETVAMPQMAPLGAPPEMPANAVEDPTNMPPAKAVPGGNPTDAALPPGRVPPGDSRSLRRGGEFALIYRQGTFVISRFGVVGQRGQWRVVEYPTSSSASHSYAKECSRFVADGFSDYRD